MAMGRVQSREAHSSSTTNSFRRAAFLAGLSKLDTGQESSHRPEKLAYYMCHYEFTPSFIVDVTAQHERKMEAVHCFRSQVYNPDYPGEQTLISSPEYLESIETRSRYYGWQIRKKYGEPFLMRESLEVNDIMSLVTGEMS